MSGRVICFGEVLLRLSAPAGQMLLQVPGLQTNFGGAEVNVAVSLARLGHAVGVTTVLPDNALGCAARDCLRGHGLGVEGVRLAAGRMGLYFLTPGAGPRPPEVLYDRAGSAFAEAEPDLIDWDRELAGAGWLHLSGITPAVGPKPAGAARRAVAAARRAGLTISFDCNYRRSLWERWGGEAATVLRDILSHADLMFGDERDVALLLGGSFEQEDAALRRRAAADHAFAALPRLQRIASTIRRQQSAERHELTGFLATREETWQTRPYAVAGIVDRIGGGDAFAAGLIHGLRTGYPPEAALDFAVAAGVLKHGLSGDFNLAGEAEIAALAAGETSDVRR